MRYLKRPFELRGADKLIYECLYENIYNFDEMLVSKTISQISILIYEEFRIEYTNWKISKSIKDMIEKGYIEIIKKGSKGNSSIYKITKLESKKVSDKSKTKKDDTNKFDENKIVEAYTNNEKLKEAIKDYISMRKSIKKVMTERAIKLLLNKLDLIAKENDAYKILMLNVSIERNYLSVFEIDSYIKKKQNKNKIDIG